MPSVGERAQLLLTWAEISRGLSGLSSVARHWGSVFKLLLASVSLHTAPRASTGVSALVTLPGSDAAGTQECCDSRMQ